MSHITIIISSFAEGETIEFQEVKYVPSEETNSREIGMCVAGICKRMKVLLVSESERVKRD